MLHPYRLLMGEAMKKNSTGTAALLLAAVLFLEVPVQAISAEKAVVMDPVGNTVVYEKNSLDPSLIASTTKIMTGLLVAETCNVLEQVRIPKEAVGVEGSSMYLQEGEVLTVQELLYGMMLRSGNDAAAALAIHCAGSIPQFAVMMNQKAAELGMKGSHFENPHGLDGVHHISTARDLGILSCAAMKNPIFLKTVSTKQIRVGDRYLKNHNKLLWRYPGCDGVKTGYTKAAGRILVSSAVKDGRRLTAVTINDPDDWNTHTALLDQGFRRFQKKLLFHKGQKLQDLPVEGGTGRTVPIFAGEDFSFFMAEGERAVALLQGPGFVFAPVVKGASAGEALVLVSGTVSGKIPVFYGRTVEQESEETHFLNRIFGGRS